jgi:hypothetical protein
MEGEPQHWQELGFLVTAGLAVGEAWIPLTRTKFIFIALVDNRTCDHCQQYDGRAFTDEEALTIFPYLQVGRTVWEPKVHPNCRCKLIMVEGEPLIRIP